MCVLIKKRLKRFKRKNEDEIKQWNPFTKIYKFCVFISKKVHKHIMFFHSKKYYNDGATFKTTQTQHVVESTGVFNNH